jgi:hypothetical protein
MGIKERTSPGTHIPMTMSGDDWVFRERRQTKVKKSTGKQNSKDVAAVVSI